ncbi:MAG: PIN domain nuclease [Firmicutes bacterium]|nr:PIN domain nuclease [Bacillota bacterium]
MKIYLDTSVISHLDQSDAPDKRKDTLLLWEEIKKGLYEVYISEIVVKELKGNEPTKYAILKDYLAEIDYNFIPITAEIKAYANKLVEQGILTVKSYDDGQHIASAVISNCEKILSWNFKHMVKTKTVNGVKTISELLGYGKIDIIPPSMLVERGYKWKSQN